MNQHVFCENANSGTQISGFSLDKESECLFVVKIGNNENGLGSIKLRTPGTHTEWADVPNSVLNESGAVQLKLQPGLVECVIENCSGVMAKLEISDVL